MMTGTGAAILDPEVEAVSEDEKAKQKREAGFLYHGATLPVLDGLYAHCYMREIHFYIGLRYNSHTCIFSHALQPAKMVRWMFIHCGVMFGIV